MRKALVSAFVLALCVPATAEAAFPGQNGKIAFSHDGDIWSLSPDDPVATRTNLTNTAGATEAAPAWSPDGAQIAYARGGDVWKMLANGSGQVNVTNTAGTVEKDPGWSPDGAKLVFAVDGVNPEADPCHPAEASGIWITNADGTGTTRVGCVDPNPSAIYVDPAWSPDGQTIVFGADGRELWAVAAPGGTATPLTATSDELHANPNWSSNNAKIVYNREIPSGQLKIWTMDADGGNEGQLRPILQEEFDPAWSPDGTKIVFHKPAQPGVPSAGLFLINANGTGDTFIGAGNEPDWQSIPINAYSRPKSASPVKVSLVTAYEPCTSPNRQHGPPLAFDSCHPPTQSSAQLTVGTFDANQRQATNDGYLSLRTKLGDPTTTADEADVEIKLYIDDVFTTDLDDYAGELLASVPLRITDKLNSPHPGGPGAGTTQDFSLDADIDCIPTPEPNEGSACELTTSADAIVPGSIPEGRRSIWQLGQVVVYDGGPDGKAATADNTVFARQGVFIP